MSEPTAEAARQSLADVNVFDMSSAGMVLTDRTGCFRRVNSAFARLVGRSVEDLLGQPFSSLTSPDDIAVSRAALKDLLDRTADTARFEKRYLRPDGTLVWVDMSIRSLLDPEGEVVGFLTQAVDISARKAAEIELRHQALLFGAISDAVFVSDADGLVRDCNPAAERLAGRSRRELLEMSDGDPTPEYRLWIARMQTAIADGGWAGDVTFRPDGPDQRLAEATIVAMHDVDGAVTGGIAICRDVTDARANAAALARAERRARHDALHDALTGLPNRKMLAARFEELLEPGREPAGTALLMIDLDRFKEVNDTLGHQCGDQLLVQVGRRLLAAVREGDTVARLGGDEFGVLMLGVADTEAAMALADRIQLALEQPFRVEGIDLDVEASVGVALAGKGLDVASVLRHADVAMYVAKRQGLGSFAYDPSADGHSPARLSLLGELRGALRRHELVLHYQPKISLSTGDVVGAEALVRWQHPKRGLVPPGDFVPLAEHTGLIRSLTKYVLDAALAEERRWIDAGRPLPIAVNLSARNLLEDGLVEQIVRLLKRHDVPANLLELEITESTVVTEIAHVGTLLARLRALGIRVAIDDFGAGFTSLAQLKNLQVSELKIDRSFVAAMAKSGSEELIVRSVIELSHNLGLTAVAEGVETPTELATLAGFGCDVAQGFHLSKPLPSEVFADWYAEWRAGRATAANGAWAVRA